MTPHFSAVSPDSRDYFDTGPLSWVMGEIREALARSKTALFDALEQDDESRSTSLRHAKTYLHQAHGALQMVDIDGVATVTETIEALLEELASGQLPLSQDNAQVIASAYQAVAEYLEELLSGAPHQPVRLFPYYQALLELRGADRIHPADLFFPNLAGAAQLPLESSALAPAIDHATLRQRFEKALLSFLKSSDAAASKASAESLRALIAEVEQAQGDRQVAGFWRVMHGFAEAVAAGQVDAGRYVKQLFALINLQIRRVAEGSPSIAERVLRDALFFIARIEQPSVLAAQIRQAYRLDGQVPQDYEKRRYGQIDVAALGLAKERLSHAKNMWSRITGGDASLAASFEIEMKGLAEASTRLNAPSLSKLLRELNGIARHAAHSKPGDLLGLEMATSLLFIDNALDHISHLSDDFSARADALTARLLSIVTGETPAESAPWLDDLSRQAQQRQTMLVLAGEMQSSLRQVEKTLDEYFLDPSRHVLLPPLDPVLHQIAGALAVLDQDDAMLAVQHTQATLNAFVASSAESIPGQPAFQALAQNIGALGFFLEMLPLHPAAAKQRFVFDPEQGVFRANLLEQQLAAEAPVAADTVAEEASASIQFASTDELPTVEDELAQHQRESAELAISLVAEPDNPALQQQLKAALEQVRSDAALVDDPAAIDRAQAAITLLAQPDFVASQDALAGIINAPVVADVSAVTTAPAITPATDAAVDAELLEIFMFEAEEVLGTVKHTVPQSRAEVHNQEYLATLRRSFHTLKGSGRMVGLTTLGAAAWSIEQVLNLWLSESRAGTEDLYALLDKAAEELDAWVAEIKQDGRSERTGDALVSAAERVKIGGPFHFDEPVGAVLPPLAEAVATDETLPATHDDAPALEVTEPSLPDSALEFAALEALEPALDTFSAAAAALVPESVPVPESSSKVIELQPYVVRENRHDDSLKQIGEIEISVPLYNIYLAETDQIVRLLSQDFAEWRHEPQRQVAIQSVHAAHSLAGSSATVGFKALQEVAHALELVLQRLARHPVPLLVAEYDTLEQSVERQKLMLQQFALGDLPGQELEQVRSLERLLQAVVDRSTAMPDESAHPPVIDLADSAQWQDATTEPLLELEPAVVVSLPLAEALSSVAPLFVEPLAAVDLSMVPKDELDADLLPVFLEEGIDILPQIGQSLRAWQQQPTDAGAPQALLRLLHTIKGSARMAGAMALGQHAHEMESRIEQIMPAGLATPLALEDLLARHDHSMQLFERLQNPQAKPPLVPLAGDDESAVQDAAETGLVAAPGQVVASAKTLVRVRADILDRMVNQAGEVSISRSRLENEVDTLRSSLSELTENVARLRSQLREIEIQAETQIMSLMPQSGDREFDPLEFDRYTRLQELTRMMAESVDDVASVQQNLTRTVDGASTDLSNQARLTRDLQQDLMRVRMVPFASIAERLYRVARQSAKELDKRVNLDIRGAAVEIDRGVLEKMAGPFEHLLRNAIVHGIETRGERRMAGKDETGELLVEIRQEGNEVVIHFSDDGQGLNLRRIRNKARTVGLLAHDSDVTDIEAADLIFQPGFSTADEITELAGRGVGMDVVRSEAAALGGRVALASEAGKGAHFTIHLPLTLAVTQVVLVTTGGKTYALPSVLVEQVQQLKAHALASAYNEGAVQWQGNRVVMHYLASLLGDHASSALAQQYSPLIILKSGNERVALHVDAVLGNREVVVKNIGPQLARLAGIAGATVLGSGDIVLILNPLPLAQRAAQDNLRAPRILPSDAPDEMGAVADMQAHPVPALRTQQIVMVVDDSLTVRRVTQRLLTREGYQVVLAKDGIDALEQLQTITPDVMLVDIEMPRMDGFDLTRNVRSDERTRRVPIIMITSRTADKHRNYAMELGVNQYFGKPFREDLLLAAIAGFIQQEIALV